MNVPKEPNESESIKLIEAYNSNRERFEALYEDGCFPPLCKKMMHRLRRGIGSLEEEAYYHQTKEGRALLEEQEFNLKDHLPKKPKRGRIGGKPDIDPDWPF